VRLKSGRSRIVNFASTPEGTMADIQHGWDVYGSDEEKVGNVSEVRSDYIVAHKGFFFPKDLYIPTSAIARIEHDRVYLNVAKADVDNQGWDTYPDQGGTVPTTGRTGAETTREQIPDAIGTPGLSGSTDEGGRTVRAAGTGAADIGEKGWDTAEKVPVTTEEVRVGKREVTENRQVTDTVRREQAHIENEGNTRINGDAEMTERGKL